MIRRKKKKRMIDEDRLYTQREIFIFVCSKILTFYINGYSIYSYLIIIFRTIQKREKNMRENTKLSFFEVR